MHKDYTLRFLIRSWHKRILTHILQCAVSKSITKIMFGKLQSPLLVIDIGRWRSGLCRHIEGTPKRDPEGGTPKGSNLNGAKLGHLSVENQ
ncbi:hypothetical protein OPIT5_04855 [Opitutaceae bacterium TAV5]|nr:hypothetical protein OPIT5_04855 [Opitutaceae bacterium TAV5]